MSHAVIPALQAHPLGEPADPQTIGHNDTFSITTPGGVFQVRYEPDAAVSQLAGLVPFAQFLHASELFDAWLADAPLHYTGHRAHGSRDVLGTLLLSLISGHSRFAHMAGLRYDTVAPTLLNMSQVVSDDTVRRALQRMIDEAVAGAEPAAAALVWARRHLRSVLMPLIEKPWILDIDVTVKPVYGYQEGSVVGYSPVKPGRPSHALHSFVMAQTRLVLDVAVRPGNEHGPDHTLCELQRLLASLDRARWPQLLRGDCAFGNQDMMAWAESQGLTYLFKQRQTKRTKQLIREIDLTSGWTDVGQGWEAKQSTLQLSTWDVERSVVVLRRPERGPRYPRAADLVDRSQPVQDVLDCCQPFVVDDIYEYQVLVTNLQATLASLVQCYRDRADVENVFDEIKNQWGWGGFTSRTFAVTQLMAIITATAYNWWSFFCRLFDPAHHREAITTRPAILLGSVRQTTHSNQRTLSWSSPHGDSNRIAVSLCAITRWLAKLCNAEHWAIGQRLEVITRAIFPGQMGVMATSTT